MDVISFNEELDYGPYTLKHMFGQIVECLGIYVALDFLFHISNYQTPRSKRWQSSDLSTCNLGLSFPLILLEFLLLWASFFQHFELRGSPFLLEKVYETNPNNAFIFLLFLIFLLFWTSFQCFELRDHHVCWKRFLKKP